MSKPLHKVEKKTQLQEAPPLGVVTGSAIQQSAWLGNVYLSQMKKYFVFRQMYAV